MAFNNFDFDNLDLSLLRPKEKLPSEIVFEDFTIETGKSRKKRQKIVEEIFENFDFSAPPPKKTPKKNRAQIKEDFDFSEILELTPDGEEMTFEAFDLNDIDEQLEYFEEEDLDGEIIVRSPRKSKKK